MKKIIFIVIIPSLLISCITTKSPTEENSQTYEKKDLRFDLIYFNQFYWDQPADEIIADLGQPILKKELNDNIYGYFFKGTKNVKYPNVVSAGFHRSNDGLRSITITILSNHNENPENYLKEYYSLSSFLESQYNKPVKSEILAKNSDVQITGLDLLNQKIAFYEIWKLGNAIMMHAMFYEVNHMNHILSFIDPSSQDIDAAVREFERNLDRIF